MSWAEAVAGRTMVAGPSELDSKRFGLSVARIVVPPAATVDVGGVVAEIDRQDADVCVLRYPASQQRWFAALREQYDVLLADCLVYWRLVVGRGRPPEPRPGATIEHVVHAADATALAGEIFRGYRSHYGANPVFDPVLVHAGYQDWAARRAADGAALRLSIDGTPAGLATIDVGTDVLEVLLAGIRPARQGEGWYPHLLAAVEERADGTGTGAVVISTQADNTPVQRRWAAYGFEPVEALLTVHVMRPA